VCVAGISEEFAVSFSKVEASRDRKCYGFYKHALLRTDRGKGNVPCVRANRSNELGIVTLCSVFLTEKIILITFF
jgi:hypothetical protein